MSTEQTDSVVPKTDSAAPKTDSAAPNTSSVVPEVVIELIEQSETIQGWMGRLGDHAGDARPEVLERVKKDYRGRLEGVAGELAEHRPDLAQSLDDRQGAVVSLRSDRDRHVAELEEVGLRHSVGEFSKPQWDSHRTKIEGWLDDVDAKLEIEEGAVSELTTALERIDASGPPRKTVAFTSEGLVEVERMPLGGGNAKNGSWSTVLTGMKKNGHSDAAARIPAAGENGSADSDELDFIDAVSRDDLEALDPVVAATRSRVS